MKWQNNVIKRNEYSSSSSVYKSLQFMGAFATLYIFNSCGRQPLSSSWQNICLLCQFRRKCKEIFPFFPHIEYNAIFNDGISDEEKDSTIKKLLTTFLVIHWIQRFELRNAHFSPFQLNIMSTVTGLIYISNAFVFHLLTLRP